MPKWKRRGGADREFWETAGLNEATARQYYNRLTELSISMFEWRNLPDSVDPRYLELLLFSQGQAVFFSDPDIGYLALANAAAGNYNVYLIPKRRRAYAANGYQRWVDDTDSVIIYNNYLHKNSMLDVKMFSRRLANLDRAIDVNANAQKTPVLIQCTENELQTMKNLYTQWEGNIPVIYGDKGMNPKPLQVLKTEAPYVADKLYQLKTQVWNEALTYLGISNINLTKKERLITDEVTRNQGGTIASRYSRLNARQDAAKAINKMFGLNIQVDYREDYQYTELDEVNNNTNTQGGEPSE